MIPIPPQHLQDWVGPGGFENVGRNWFNIFLQQNLVTPRTRVLDIGVGCGRSAVHFIDFLDKDVPYEGFDVYPEAVRWCQENFPPNFHFQLADIHNQQYNPTGSMRSADYVFPYPDDSFDLVCLLSVFTHMLPTEVEHYVSEIRRVLSPTGKCLSTFFLLDEHPRPDRGDLTFHIRHNDDCYYNEAANPSVAVAYTERYVTNLLRPDRILYDFQDIVIWGK